MKKMHFSCCRAFLCLLFCCGSAWGGARPLTIGDAVPPYTIRHIRQFATPSAPLSRFHNQLLILDFMTTYCGSCIAHLHRMDTLEKGFAGRLQVFPVTRESIPTVDAFLSKSFLGKKITSPMIAGDSVLHSWFPHQYVSHTVWIYGGVVKAITAPEYVTAAHIRAMLSGETLNLPVKRDIPAYDPAIPLLAPNAESLTAYNLDQVHSYTAVTHYIDGLNAASGIYTDSAARLQRLYLTNSSILRLYLTATGLPVDFPPSQILLQVQDKARLINPHTGFTGDWRRQHYYCYEAAAPLTVSKAHMLEKMLADLQFSLHLQGRVVQRKVRCWSITKTARDTFLLPPPDNRIDLSGLLIRLNAVYGGLPVFTNIPPRERIYLPNPADLQDTPGIKALLQQYGLTVQEEERTLPFLLLSDAPAPAGVIQN